MGKKCINKQNIPRQKYLIVCLHVDKKKNCLNEKHPSDSQASNFVLN